MPNSIPPGFRILVVVVAGSLIIIIFQQLSKALNWCLRQFDLAVRDYFQSLNNWVHQKKRNKIRRKIAFLLKCFIGFVGILAGPEATAIVVRNVSNRWARALLRCIYPLVRLFTLLALFLGSTFYSLRGVQFLLNKFSFLEPHIGNLINVVSGYSNVPKTVLFAERLAKVSLGTLLLHFGIQQDPKLSNLRNSKEYLKLGIFGLCMGSVVFIIWDPHGILPQGAFIFTSQPSVRWLTHCILGRSILLLGAGMILPRTFWTSTFFLVLVYTFGLYSLLLSSSSNLFPKNF